MSANIATVQTDSVVVSLMRASAFLAEAKSIGATKKILDIAAAAEIYVRRQHLGEEAEGLAVSIKVEALRKLGEMLKATPKAKARFDEGSKKVPSRNEAPTLAELGLTKKESAVAQKLAEMPEKAFEQVRDGHVTIAKALAAVTEAKARPSNPPPAKPKAEPPKTAEQLEAEQFQADAMDGFDPLVELEAARKQIAALMEQIKALTADDRAAELRKYILLYENARQERDDKQALTAKFQTDLQRLNDRFLRIGKLFDNERDTSKIAAKVEQFVREHRKAVEA